MARNRLVWLVCLSILSVLSAGATFQTYATLGQWQAVTEQWGNTIDFDSLQVEVGKSKQYSSLFIDPVTFTSPPAYWMTVFNPSGLQPWYDWNTTSILRCDQDGSSLKVALETPATAFAAFMGINKLVGEVYVSSTMRVEVRSVNTVVWGAEQAQNPLNTDPHPKLTFFGIVSTNPAQTFDSVTFTPVEVNTAFLDDVMLGAYQEAPPPPPPVPEMGTGVLSLCGGILLAAGGFRMRGKPS